MTANNWKRYLPQIVVAITATLSGLSDGIHFSWCSPMLLKLQESGSPIHPTKTDEDWLELLYLMGGIAGLPLTMYLVDKFGRKKSIIIASINGCVVWALIGFAWRVEVLYVARFMAGVGADMAFVSVPMYIGEVAEKHIRGLLTSLITLQVLIGVVVCYCVVPFVSMFASSCIGFTFVALQVVSLSFMPESAYYHLLKGRPEQAEKSLKWSRWSDNVEKELEEVKAAVKRQSSESGSFKDLVVVHSNRKALLIMTFLNASQHMSGLSVMFMNVHKILRDADGAIAKDSAAIYFAIIMLLSTIVASGLVDRFGRKVLLVISSLLCALSHGALSTYFFLKADGYGVTSANWVPIFAVFLFAAAFRFGLGLVPIVVTSEIFPTSVKAKGMTTSDAMFVVFGTLSIYMYQEITAVYGIYVPFAIFCLWCVGGVVFTVLFIPETKGKTLEQIQMMLKGEKVAVDGTS